MDAAAQQVRAAGGTVGDGAGVRERAGPNCDLWGHSHCDPARCRVVGPLWGVELGMAMAMYMMYVT